MGALIVLIGGCLGFVFAGLAFLCGANLFWILGIYVLSGHIASTLLLWRYYGRDEDEALIEAQIAIEMEALRDYQAAKYEARRRASAEGSSSIFGLLRQKSRTNSR